MSLFSWPEYQEYRDHNQTLAGLVAYAPFAATMRDSAGVREVQGQLIKTWQLPSRILAVLSSALSLLALLLAATGIFGVVNYAVSQRTHEIGTRMALGATSRRILGLIISQSLRPVLVGALIGLAAAAAASRILSSLLFGISPLDPLTFVTMWLVLFAVAYIASYAPAGRAARIDPAAALRHQ